MAGIAALAGIAAIGLWFAPLFDALIPLACIMPIVLAAGLGGAWPGVTVTVLAAGLVGEPWIESLGTAAADGAWKALLLALAGISISLVCERMQPNPHRAGPHDRDAPANALTAARLAAIVTSSDDAIIGKDLDGIVTSWNESSERIFGYSAAQMVGQPITLLIPPELLPEEVQILERLRSGLGVTHYQTVRRHKNGAPVHVSISVAPIRDATGTIIGASKIARDITGQRQAELRSRQLQDELAHVARLSAMGQMSAAIAHELNQPLTAIMNYTRASQRMLDNGSSPGGLSLVRETLEKVALQTMRAGNTIRYLRDFVEKREVPRTLEDINFVVEEALTQSLVNISASNVKTRLDLATGLPRLEINKIQIQQVLLNLVRNSIEAIAGAPDGEIALSTARDGKDTICITVRDSGPGVPPQVVAKLFQPFVTSKEDGMGIGLRICQAIVQAHGGDIALANSGGTPTEFRIRLPLRKEQPCSMLDDTNFSTGTA